MSEPCGVGSLFEDLTSTPVEGCVAVNLLLMPLVVPAAVISEPAPVSEADEMVIDAPIYREVTIEAWIGPEGTTLPPPPPPPDEEEEPDLDDVLELESGDLGLELETSDGDDYIDLEA
jgi:hypothetical protein